MPLRSASCLSSFARKRSTLGVCGVFVLAVLSLGCLKEALFLGYLIGGPPSIAPDFEEQTNKSLTDYEVTVAVVCYVPKELKWDFADVDKDIAKYVTHRLHQKKVKVVRPESVQDWLDKNPDWDTAAEIGAHFKAKYVVDIEISDYSLYEKGSSTLYRGRAEVNVTVWEIDENGEGERIYTKPIKSEWPLAVAKPTTEITYTRFRLMYLQRLSERIGRLFYEHYNGADIGEVM
ncbi:MAG: hypothetical protein ACE5KM_18530 [Planctomycetaceae bacterium]